MGLPTSADVVAISVSRSEAVSALSDVAHCRPEAKGLVGALHGHGTVNVGLTQSSQPIIVEGYSF